MYVEKMNNPNHMQRPTSVRNQTQLLLYIFIYVCVYILPTCPLSCIEMFFTQIQCLNKAIPICWDQVVHLLLDSNEQQPTLKIYYFLYVLVNVFIFL